MPTIAAVGRSTSEDSFEAGRLAATEAIDGLSDRRPDLAIVFGTTGYSQKELLRGVRSITGDAKLVGCSGEGIISHGDSLEQDHAVAVMAIQSDTLSFDTFLLGDYSADSRGRGTELAERIVAGGIDDAIGLLVFPDGLSGNCTDFLEALAERLPVPLVVTGGASADALKFTRTYQYAGDSASSDSIAAVLLRGQGCLEFAVSHGCSPIGLERTVTRGEGGWVYEIDNQPAWSVFKEYLDGDPEDLNAEGIAHLCIGKPLERPESSAYPPYVIRTPMSLDSSTGALFFPGGGMQSDQTIQLTRRDPSRIRESARECAQELVDSQPSRRPALVLQFDCAGRGRALFGTAVSQEIVQPLQETIGNSTPWLGFHTYGEIAPVRNRLYYHNYTVVLCAVYDTA